MGYVESTTRWTASKFGDLSLMFKHEFWPDELDLRPDVRRSWERIVTTNRGGFMDTEGPEKYRRYLNRGRRLRRVLNMKD